MRHAPLRPVFHDGTGRRRRVVVLTGLGVAAVLLAGLIVLLTGLSGSSDWRVPGFPDANRVADHPPSPSPEPVAATSAAADPPLAGTDPAADSSPVAEPTSPRRIPTQTPAHQPKPTKT